MFEPFEKLDYSEKARQEYKARLDFTATEIYCHTLDAGIRQEHRIKIAVAEAAQLLEEVDRMVVEKATLTRSQRAAQVVLPDDRVSRFIR